MGKMRKRFRIKEFKQRGHGIGFPIVAAIAVVAVMLVGCGDDDDPMVVFDNGPPSAPDGVYSITGDLQVEICWNPNPEDDIAGYEVYWNSAPTGQFSFVARITNPNTTCYIDTDVDNGTTYFYAVLAYDNDGLESELSYEDVFDTPRPEGTNLFLFDYLGQNSGLSGYDFSSEPYGIPQAWDNPTTDVYFGAPNGVPTLFADQGAGVDVQDYGYIDLIYVSWAPTAGWAPSGQVELIPGHSYIVRIVDNGTFNMAKIYVVSVSAASVTLDWAYQKDTNNQELAPGVGGAQR
jgi:hypothetical protein